MRILASGLPDVAPPPAPAVDGFSGSGCWLSGLARERNDILRGLAAPGLGPIPLNMADRASAIPAGGVPAPPPPDMPPSPVTGMLIISMWIGPAAKP